MIYLTIINNPFEPKTDREVRQLNVIPGMPVKNYLVSCLIPENYNVYLASKPREIGRVLTTEEIDTVELIENDAIIITPNIGKDGQDKSMTLAAIAVMIMSYGASYWITTTYGTTGAAAFWASAAAIAVQIAGGMIIANCYNKKQQADTTAYGWGRIESSVGEGTTIPITFGRVRTGGHIMSAYVDYDGSNTYLNLLYSLGEGPCDYIGNGEDENCTGIDNVLINGNPLTDYSGVVLYKRAGLNNQSVIPNFNDTKIDKTVAIELEAGNDWTTITTDGDAVDGLEVVLECPALYASDSKGKRKDASVFVNLEYKLNSDTEWKQYLTKYKTPAYYREGYDENGNMEYKWLEVAGDQTLTFPAGKAVTIYWNGGSGTRTVVSSTYSQTPAGNITIINLNQPAVWSTIKIETICNIITLSGNSTNAVRGIYVFDNLNPPGKYSVRAKCIGKTASGASDQTTVYYKTLTSIAHNGYSHPNMTLVGIRALANEQLDGSMPQVTFEVTRSHGWIWNPYTSTYVQKDLTTPAWAAYDMICRVKQYQNIHTSAMETVVEGIAVTRMDYDSFNEAATYQEGLFNGKARCNCNYILDTTETLYDALKEIETVGRMKIIPRGTRYSCVCDMPVTTPVQMFNSANTKLGSFTEAFTAIDNRANSIEVRFRNKDNDYEWDVATVSVDDYDELGTVPNPVQITLNACTDWYYAHQIGAYMLRQNQLVRRTISHSHDIDAIGVQVGDVYYYQTDTVDWGIGGRLVAADTSGVTLDQDVHLESGTSYQIIVRLADDTLVTKSISFTGTQTTNVLQVASAFTTPPAADDIYSFGSVSIAAKPFRAISVSRDGDLQYKITGIEYVAAVYEELANVPTPNYTASTPVTSLTVNSYVDSEGAPVINIAWIPPRDIYGGATIEVNGKKVGRASPCDTAFSYPVEATGAYTIKVTALDMFGNNTGSAVATHEVTQNDPPTQPTIATIDTAVKGFTVNL